VFDKAHNTAVGDRADEVAHIWKQGFPVSTPEEDAVSQAIDAVRKSGESGEIISTEILQSEAHKKAGEFLVKLCLGEKRT
jgi:hypothetical protein